jgi:transposase
MNYALHDWKEARRLHAWHLKQQGWSQRQIAAALGVSEGAVSQWRARGRADGPDALRHLPPPGAPCRLTAEPPSRLPALLQRGPAAYGVRGELWARTRIAAIIRLACGVSYHPRHVSRLLDTPHWSLQNPTRRARQRHEAATARWRGDTWPAIKRVAQVQQQTILFIDESWFYPLPSVVRPYAPVGQTPVLWGWRTHDHLSAISAISPEGKLYCHSQDHPINSDDVVGFLERLVREMPGRLVLTWDGAPIYRSQVIRASLANGTAQRLHLERLPAYTPELNPGEGLWQQLKGIELRNVCGFNIPHLRHE